MGFFQNQKHRRKDGVNGIYHCEIPDSRNVNQTIYIGVVSASAREWYIYPIIVIHVLQFYTTEE